MMKFIYYLLDKYDLEELLGLACIFTFVIVPGIVGVFCGILFPLAWVFLGK